MSSAIHTLYSLRFEHSLHLPFFSFLAGYRNIHYFEVASVILIIGLISDEEALEEKGKIEEIVEKLKSAVDEYCKMNKRSEVTSSRFSKKKT